MHRHIRSGSRRRAVRQGAAVLFAAGILVWLSWLVTPRRNQPVPPGGRLEPIRLWTAGGSPGSLQACRVILVVSAECPSCLIALRLMGRVGEEAGRTGLLACVSMSPPEETRRLVEESGVRCRVLFAGGPELRAAWKISVVPAMIVRDRNGTVLDVLSGSRCIERGPAVLAGIVREELLP